MTTDGFESLALRSQIIGRLVHVLTLHLCTLVRSKHQASLFSLSNTVFPKTENCDFFDTTRGDIGLIITHEPIGTYKAIVLSGSSRRRDVLLSSDSFNTVTKAVEHLFIKSTDAVQQYITTNGFRRLPSKTDDDDDGVSSVSSYADDADKDCLADSSLSLESELESAYESLSEDGEGTIGHSRVKRSGDRPRSYDVRTGRRQSRSRSRSRSRDRTPTYPKAPAPPLRYPLHNAPGHRSRAADAPRPYGGPTAGNESGGMRCPPLPAGFTPPPLMSQPPHLPRGLMAHFQRQDAIIQQQREAKRGHQDGHKAPPGFIDLGDAKAAPQPSLPLPGAFPSMRSGHMTQPGPWSQVYAGSDTRNYMPPPPPMMGHMPWSLGPQSIPHEQELPAYKPPMKIPHQMGRMPSPPPAMQASTSSVASSTASSSAASSSPTVTVGPSTPPGAGSSSSGIDYRLVIKTARGGGIPDHETVAHEHRMIARTAPTRSDIAAVALAHVQRNMWEFVYLKGVSKENMRGVVTRAVFPLGQGREESYDLTAYADHDFGKLCESMRRAGEKDDRGGVRQLSGWPLFEVWVL